MIQLKTTLFVNKSTCIYKCHQLNNNSQQQLKKYILETLCNAMKNVQMTLVIRISRFKFPTWNPFFMKSILKMFHPSYLEQLWCKQLCLQWDKEGSWKIVKMNAVNHLKVIYEISTRKPTYLSSTVKAVNVPSLAYASLKLWVWHLLLGILKSKQTKFYAPLVEKLYI